MVATRKGVADKRRGFHEIAKRRQCALTEERSIVGVGLARSIGSAGTAVCWSADDSSAEVTLGAARLLDGLDGPADEVARLRVVCLVCRRVDGVGASNPKIGREAGGA